MQTAQPTVASSAGLNVTPSNDLIYAPRFTVASKILRRQRYITPETLAAATGVLSACLDVDLGGEGVGGCWVMALVGG